MNLNVTRDDTPKRPDEFINLPWVGATNCISDADSVHTNPVHGLIDRQEIHKIRAERILWWKSNFDTLGFDKCDDLNGRLGNVSHVLSMRKLTEERRCADDDVDAVNTLRIRSENDGFTHKMGGLPVSTAIRASSIWQRMWVRILAFSPSLQIASQSRRDCSEAAGDVSSMYSTPKASSALAIAILVFVSKNALANCSPSTTDSESFRKFYQRLESAYLGVCSRWYWN